MTLNMVRLLSVWVLVCGANVFVAVAAPVMTSDDGVVEFELPRGEYEDHDWHHNDPAVEQERIESEEAYGNTNRCPDSIQMGADKPIHVRSSCPWYYVSDHDAYRFPRTILRAETKCQYCIGSNGESECHAIMQTIKVLRQQDFNNGSQTFKYEEDTMRIAVGFTCGGPSTTSAPTTTTPRPPFTFAKK